MDRKRFWRFGLVWLAVMGMLMPVSVVNAAGAPRAPARVASDVTLSADGALRGQVLTPQGRGLSGMHVTVSDGTRDLGSTVSVADGRFEIRGLKGGVLTLTAGQGKTVCRVWTSTAAPPAAGQQVLLVAGQQQTLGQSFGGIRGVLTNPWVIAGIVAAAVAIPVAIHNSNNDDPASP